MDERDATSLPTTGRSLSNSEIFQTAQRLSAEVNVVLHDLDEYEAISLVFLLVDDEYLALHGFKYCQYISNGRLKETMNQLVMIVQRTNNNIVAVIEGLYIIGRYDLLEDRLGLCIDQNFRSVFSGKIASDRKALYFVFAGMAQEEADRIVQSRLTHWKTESGRPLEETFARNLNIGNYNNLITELNDALIDENKEVLAIYLRQFIQRPSSERLCAEKMTSYVNRDNFYPGPSCYPHGLCIIINVKSFIKPKDQYDNIPLNERHGSDIDKERLTGTFKLFGFHVMHFDNPDYEQIHQFFKGLRVDPRLAVVSCLAVCVMTHGDENDQIYLHDRTCMSITDMRKLCFSQALLDKPRLYFVQACRGEQGLQPIFLQKDVCSVAHMESDCLISAATVKGYSALRSQSEGSWYITDLCTALQDIGHISPIKNVLQKTRQFLKARVGNMNNSYVTQLSEDKDTLTKDVQLVRASEDHFIEGIMDLVQLEVLEKLVEDQLDVAFNVPEDNSGLRNVINSFSHCLSLVLMTLPTLMFRLKIM